MKSALQIQLDNQYEVLRVAYLKKREESASIHAIHVRNRYKPLKDVPAELVRQSANWDLAWFSHYE